MKAKLKIGDFLWEEKNISGNEVGFVDRVQTDYGELELNFVPVQANEPTFALYSITPRYKLKNPKDKHLYDEWRKE